jgi:hypothetical protein
MVPKVAVTSFGPSMTSEHLPVLVQGPLQPEKREALSASADRSTLGGDDKSVRANPTVQARPLLQLILVPVTEPPPAPAN